MSELLLDSLEIKGYRCFEHLTIEKLGRVNLIVGKNNVGKTSLLEAIRIYIQDAKFSLLREILVSRNEISSNIRDFEDLSEYFENLFFKRDLESANKIEIGKSKSDRNKIAIQIRNKGGNPDEQLLFDGISNRDFYNSEELALIISKGSEELVSIPLLNENFRKVLFLAERKVDSKPMNIQFVKANGLNETDVAKLWDSVVLTELENFTTQALQLIAPEILRISFRGEENRSLRIPIVKTEKSNKPFSLRSLGEGMSRILGIALSLANSKNGILMIDEIESGLHYSALVDVWKLIFKTAKDLNVQVFATTHSDDCYKAFNEVANANDEKDDGMLIRLERQGEKIIAKTVVEERLALAIEHGVEMR